MKVLISAGGTGGHIYPAIAVADALTEAVKNIEILFVGASDRMEMEKVPKAGYVIKGLWISGLQRKLSIKNLLFPIKLIVSLWRSRQIIKDFKPDIAIGFGGYASGPALRMAAFMNVPCLLQEQNSYPGITNKWLSRFVNKICVAYPLMDRFFAPEKIVLTGNPVRKDLLSLTDKRSLALDHFGLDSKKTTVLLVGGSLGARTINGFMASKTKEIEESAHLQFVWQMGSGYSDTFSKSETAQLSSVKAKTFIEKMDLAYAAADIVVCRAGALTISELGLVGKAVVLIPSPFVAEDHQTKNAQSLVDGEAAIMVQDKEVDKALWECILQLSNNEEQRKSLSDKILAFGKPDAANVIAKIIIDEVNGNS